MVNLGKSGASRRRLIGEHNVEGGAESLEQIVIGAGLELLDRDGLSLTTESITYARVFDYLESEYSVRVTRGSVYERIWATQNDFRREVLTEAVGYLPIGHPAQTALGAPLLVDAADDFARQIGAQLYQGALDSPSFAQYQAAKALASRFDDPVAAQTLHQVFNQRVTTNQAEGRARNPALLATLGLRPKVELGLSADQACDVFHSLVALLFDGGHLNYHAGARDIASPVEFLSTPSTDSDPWSTVSIGIKCFLDFLYEPDPALAGPPNEAPQPWPTQEPPQVDPSAWHSDTTVRHPRQELKRLVLAAGIELLLRGGLDLKTELLGYSTVFAHIKQTRGLTVNRSSVHNRMWANNEDFHIEILTRALLRRAREPDPILVGLFESSQTTRHPDGSLHRQQTALDVIRTANDALAKLSASSNDARTLVQIKAALLHQPSSTGTAALRSAVKQLENQRTDRISDQIRTNIVDLGFQVRPELGLTDTEALDLMAVLTSTTVTGMVLDQLAQIEAASRTIRLPPLDQTSKPNQWTLPGIAMRACFEQFYQQTNRT